MKLPRIMIAAPSSGSGKTLVTCGLLQALVNRKMKISSFKCGPDYIDPMFHSKVIGTPSRNLDTFFVKEEMIRYLFGRQAKKSQLSVLEGVMGFYDGAAGITTEGSSWDLARVTKTPVILVVNARGMSLSVIALIRGFLEYSDTFSGESSPRELEEQMKKRNLYSKNSSQIRGVILNQTTKSMYPDLKREIQQALPVKVLGYVPRVEDCVIESRHLGLVTPEEISGLQQKLQKLAAVLEDSLDIEGILALAEQAPELNVSMPESLKALTEQKAKGCGKLSVSSRETALHCSFVRGNVQENLKKNPRIAVARDEAFCFYYEDNLELLEQLGAEIVPFSPIRDKKLPEDIQGLLFGGGYPELYAKQLSGNKSMLDSVRAAVKRGMPYLAECGGFMYLHETMEDMEKTSWPMAGVIPGHISKTERLGRFGYITLTANKTQIFGPEGLRVKGHEFHYFDSSNNGDAFHAQKPHRKRSWDCMVAGENFAAGFPHLYYYSNPEFAVSFVECCRSFSLVCDK